MARHSTGATEHHRPGYVARAAPQLGVDEVAEPAGGEAEWAKRSDEVHHVEPAQPVAVRDEHHRDQHAEKAAVKRHSALPDRENLERVRQIVAGLVEQHVPETPAEDDAD